MKRTSLLAVACLILVAAPNAGLLGSVITVEINDWQDGRDQLILQGSSVQWQHFDYNIPGAEDGHHDPTLITTTLDGAPILTNYPWFPQWPDGTNSGAYSAAFPGLQPALPASDMIVTLQLISVRWEASLIEVPTSANGYRTVVELNDDPPSGAAYYDVKLTFQVVPEPSIGLFAILSLLGIGLRRARARKSWFTKADLA